MDEQGTSRSRWLLYSSDWYWDHLIAKEYLALGRAGVASSDAQTMVRPWLFCYRHSFELALKSLIRAAEGKIFSNRYRTEGSESPHCDIESQVDHHHVDRLALTLDAHLRACGGLGINDDVRRTVQFFVEIDPDSYRLRYGHGLEKAGFSESVPKAVEVARMDLDRVERAILAMLDEGELTLSTLARPILEDGSESQVVGIPVRTRPAPRQEKRSATTPSDGE